MVVLRISITVFLVLLQTQWSISQIKKLYAIKSDTAFDIVNLKVFSKSGNTYLKSYPGRTNPLEVYGNPNQNQVNPTFDYKIRGRTCFALLKLDNYHAHNFQDGLNYIVKQFSNNDKEYNYWKILLNDQKIYDLQMEYGVGNTKVDLSHIKTKKLFLKSGSSNVNIGYKVEEMNQVPMDTFWILVDMGSLLTKNLGNSKANTFIAQVGFGNALLDFGGDHSGKMNCHAKIGAGSLDIRLPTRETPVIIYVNKTPFCGLTLTSDFEEVEENIYINPNYKADAKNLMVFNVDLSMGEVTFSYDR